IGRLTLKNFVLFGYLDWIIITLSTTLLYPLSIMHLKKPKIAYEERRQQSEEIAKTNAT
ncbi:hypothetical protein ACJX0J_012658, partial [Zea mays]